MNITERDQNGVTVFALEGRVDTQGSVDMDMALEAAVSEGKYKIVLEMAEVDYISSAGVRVILKAKKALKGIEGSLLFMNLQPQIKKVFDILNALPTLQVFSNIQELDDYLDAMQKKAR